MTKRKARYTDKDDKKGKQDKLIKKKKRKVRYTNKDDKKGKQDKVIKMTKKESKIY